MKRIALLAAFACSLLPAAWCADAATAQKPRRVGKYFEVTIPAGWTEDKAYFGLSDEEKKVYGLKLAQAEGGRTMAAHYYAPGNLVDRTAEKFIKLHSSPSAKGPSGPRAAGGKVGGLPAKLFGGVSYAADKPHSLDSARAEIWESYAVVPLAKGYYVLRYAAPAAGFAAGMPAFEAFVASFKPLLK